MASVIQSEMGEVEPSNISKKYDGNIKHFFPQAGKRIWNYFTGAGNSLSGLFGLDFLPYWNRIWGIVVEHGRT